MSRSLVAPLDEIAHHILRLWKARQTDRQIVEELQKHFDTSRFGLGSVFDFAYDDFQTLTIEGQAHKVP